MSKNIIILILVVISLLFLGWRLFFLNTTEAKIVNIKIKDQNYKIEIAKSIPQRVKGLSNRDSLCQNCGMLFIFDFETDLPFWMKDTLIPLDIIWLNQQGQIVDIQTATETNSQKLYRNQSPAQYVLELNANDYQKLDLKIGDTIPLPNFSE